jgi:hypothetical protein
MIHKMKMAMMECRAKYSHISFQTSRQLLEQRGICWNDRKKVALYQFHDRWKEYGLVAVCKTVQAVILCWFFHILH